jgi:hypothetical protein
LNTRRPQTFPFDNLILEHDEHVMQMNEVRRWASGRVQRGTVKVARVIEQPGHAAGTPRSRLKEETTMLKAISAALLAVSVIAAPALAASSTGQAPASKTARAPAAKTAQVKPMNANAKMDRHHGRHHAKHHRSHNKMTSLKTHKVSSKAAAPATKRG